VDCQWRTQNSAFQDAVDPDEANEKAQRYARKAMELDESLPGAHLYLAAARLNTYDFATREDDLKKALSLNPNLTEAHLLLANHYAYMSMCDDVIREIEKDL
jgi:Tfp pilus assembly protein PilF